MIRKWKQKKTEKPQNFKKKWENALEMETFTPGCHHQDFKLLQIHLSEQTVDRLLNSMISVK